MTKETTKTKAEVLDIGKGFSALLSGTISAELFTVSATRKYLDELERKGAVVDGEPLSHKELISKFKSYSFLSSSERSYLMYLREKQVITDAYENTQDWNEVISSVVYVDDEASMEAFIDIVEHKYKTKIKDSEHLIELTGCKEFKKGSKYTLIDIIYGARNSRYSRALNDALYRGFKYDQLLKLKPEFFKLPTQWKHWSGKILNQYRSILEAIDDEFCVSEPNISLLPSLKLIARELEAPYSVIMDAYKLRRQTQSETFKDKKRFIEKRVQYKFPAFIESKGKEWREEWLLEGSDLHEVAKEDIEKDYVLALSQIVLHDIEGLELRCGNEIEQDIREYFSDEVTALRDLIMSK